LNEEGFVALKCKYRNKLKLTNQTETEQESKTDGKTDEQTDRVVGTTLAM